MMHNKRIKMLFYASKILNIKFIKKSFNNLIHLTR